MSSDLTKLMATPLRPNRPDLPILYQTDINNYKELIHPQLNTEEANMHEQ